MTQFVVYQVEYGGEAVVGFAGKRQQGVGNERLKKKFKGR